VNNPDPLVDDGKNPGPDSDADVDMPDVSDLGDDVLPNDEAVVISPLYALPPEAQAVMPVDEPEVWDVKQNWIDTNKGNIAEHIEINCQPDGGFVKFTALRRLNAKRGSSCPGHTAAMIILDPPYLAPLKLDLADIQAFVKACSWWANEGCVLIIFVGWQEATTWCDALVKEKWSVEASQLVIIRKYSRLLTIMYLSICICRPYCLSLGWTLE
jgi:hypothetical protein